MKLLLLLALVGLAASAPSSELPGTPTRQFIYRYDSQIATGIEEVSSQFSNVRMSFEVLMQTEGDVQEGAQRWTVKFRQVNVRQRINATEQLPKTMLPMEMFRNLENSELWRQVEEALKKPFVCVIKRELSVVKISFQSEDPFWSMNIKKGFLQMLQLNFQPERETDVSSDNKWIKEKDEMTVADVCKTFYSVEKVRFHEAASRMFKVEKAIDFNNCKNPIDGTRNMPGMWNGLQHSDRIPMETDKQILNINNMGKFFVLAGEEREQLLVVKQATVRTIYTLAPYTESLHGSEKVIAIQKLRLIRRAETEDRIPVPSVAERPEGLRLIFPQEANLDETRIEALINEAVKLIKKLKVSTSNEKMDMKIYEQIVRIIRFHVKRPEQLKNMIDKLAEDGLTEQKKQLIRIFVLDICPQANTHVGVQFLMKVVRMLLKEEGHVSYTRANIFGIEDIPIIFSKLSMMGKVQLKTLNTMFNVVKSDQFRRMLLNGRTMPIYSSGWLSLGSLVNVYFSRQGGVEPFVLPIEDFDAVASQYRQTPWVLREKIARESDDFRRQFVAEVREALEASSIRRVLAIKVIKNCGLFELYKNLKVIVKGREGSISTSDRVQAIYATQNIMRRHSQSRLIKDDVSSTLEEVKYIRDNEEYLRKFEEISREIQADLLRIFRNVREDPELRIACYRVLIQSPIKQFTLNMLVQTIVSDPSQLVYTYCVQHMMQLVKSPLPRYSRCIPTIRSALSLLKRRQQFVPTFSRIFGNQMWDQLHDMGFSIETDMIVSDKSFTPRWTHFRLEHQSFGRSTPLFEIGVRTEGLQKLLEKVFGPHGSFNGIFKSLKTISRLIRERRSLPDNINVSEELSILPRLLQEMPNMEISISLMGYDVIFVSNTREVRQSLQSMSIQHLQKLVLSIQRNFQLLNNVFTIGNYYELPTPVGTILDFTCIGSFNFKLRQVAARNNLDTAEDKTDISLSLQPLLTVQAFSRVGSNMHLLSHYHQWETLMSVGLPEKTDLRLKIDYQTVSRPKINLQYTVPKETTRFFVFENKAYSTVAEFFFGSSRVQINYVKDTLKHRSIPQSKVVRWEPLINKMLAFTGIQLQISGAYFSNEQLFKGPSDLLTGPSTFSVHVKPILEFTSPIFVDTELTYVLDGESSKLRELTILKNIKSGETIVKKLVDLRIKDIEWTLKTMNFNSELRWFVNLPTDLLEDGFLLKMDAQIDMPEDLKMEVREGSDMPAQWMKLYKWVQDRQMRMRFVIKKEDDSQVGRIIVTASTNQAVKHLLKSFETQKKMKEAFPLLKKCSKEVKKSVYGKIFTPSCIEQYKEFNKLSEVKVEIQRQSSWFLSRRQSPVLDAFLQMMGHCLQPFLVESLINQESTENAVLVSQPSPLDMRVHNLNVTCRNRMMRWKSIQLPATPFYWTGVDPIVTEVVDHVKGGAVKCSMRHSHVRTFDNLIYSLPKNMVQQVKENRCPVLVAADCSEKKQFNVLTHFEGSKKIVTLVLGKQQRARKPVMIEISKTPGQTDATVKLQGRQLTVEDSDDTQETLVLKREVHMKNDKQVELLITKYPYADTTMYKIVVKELQLELIVGGPMLRTVELRVSPFYHNKVCGLCGDYNSEKMREFKGPQMQVQTSPKKMLQQWILPANDQCKELAQSEKVNIFDYEQKHETELQTPTFHLYSREDEPTQRKTCQVSTNDKSVKTFYNREMPLVTKAIRKLFKRSGCPIKLAVAKVADKEVTIGLSANAKNIHVIVNNDDKQMSISRIRSEGDKEEAFHGLKIKTQQVTKGYSRIHRITISKDDKKVVIDILRGRIFIRDAEFKNGHGVCQLSHKSQLGYSSIQQMPQLLKFITAGRYCKSTIKRSLVQCDIKQKTLEPFHRSGDLDRQQVTFLTNELTNMMAQKRNAAIVLSADRIDDSDDELYSTKMSFSKQAGKVIRHLTISKGLEKIAEIRVPEVEADSNTKIVIKGSVYDPSHCVDAKDLDYGFQCKYDGVKLSIYKPNALYGITVVIRSNPTIKVNRLLPHSQYGHVGMCDATNPDWTEVMHVSPHAVLINALRKSSESELLSDEQIAANQEVIYGIQQVEYTPYFSR